MLPKAQNKYIRSLSQQKYRKQHQAFIAEGDKIAREWLESDCKINIIVVLKDWEQQYRSLIDRHPEALLLIADEFELEAVSTLKTPNQVLLVVPIPAESTTVPTSGWCLALDDLQDPGNMGTIIRIADWFGIKNIICSPHCVDVYNPKVVQAAMGGHLRVQIQTAALEDFITETQLPVIAAALEGDDLYSVDPPGEGVILIGNESKGLSPLLLENATHKLTIPRRGGAESLNAAVSAGIFCALLVR